MKNIPPLDLNTLYRKRGETAPIWYTIDDLGLGRIYTLDILPPPIGLVSTPTGFKVGGRFFPTLKHKIHNLNYAILVYNNADPWITQGTIVHELAHLFSYCHVCSTVPKNRKQSIRCRYKGDHDTGFYNILEPMYIKAGIPLESAKIIEGNYNYPNSWNQKTSW